MQTHPYCFQTDAAHQGDRSSYVYPRSVENACWDSFVRIALGPSLNEQDIEFVVVRERCDHLIIPYPDGPVLVKMLLRQLDDGRVTLLFEHYACESGSRSPCVRSERTVACVQCFGKRMLPSQWPQPIRIELERLETAANGVRASRSCSLIAWIRSFLS